MTKEELADALVVAQGLLVAHGHRLDGQVVGLTPIVALGLTVFETQRAAQMAAEIAASEIGMFNDASGYTPLVHPYLNRVAGVRIALRKYLGNDRFSNEADILVRLAERLAKVE